MIAAGENMAIHSAGVVIEFHFKKSCPYTRHLPRASLCSCSEGSWPKRRPAKQTQSDGSERDGHCDLAAKQQKPGKQQRGYSADRTQHTRDFFGIGLDERTGGPQQQEKRHYP